jgi:hypothetical protein
VEGLNLDLLSLNDGSSGGKGRQRAMSFGESEVQSTVATSIGGRSRFSAATFASDWSQTSNMTFSRSVPLPSSNLFFLPLYHSFGAVLF